MSMTLGIDVREACGKKRTGKGQWTYYVVLKLLEKNVSLTLFKDDAPLPQEWNVENISVVQFPSGFKWHLRVAKYMKASSLDFYISPVSYLVPFLLGRHKKVLPVIHDLIAFRTEPHDAFATFVERLTLKKTVQSAAHIFTVSETTKKDLLTQYPELDAKQITPLFAGSTISQVERKKEVKDILMVSTLAPRKNQLRLMEAYTQLPESLKNKHQLILIGGRGWNDEEIVKRAQTTPGVIWKNYVPSEELQSYFSSAAIIAYPSLYEGFGMPVLDAFTIGIPVLTSDIGSMKEIARDSAVLVHPLDVKAISRGLESLLNNKTLCANLIDNGFDRAKQYSWERTTSLLLQTIEKI